MPAQGPFDKPLLVVGHPGHELCLHAWMGMHRPDYLCLTQGSGHGSASRVWLTDELLEHVGARRVRRWSPLPDSAVYADLLAGRWRSLRAFRDRLADIVAAGGFTAVVCDPADGFNPVHDLCRCLVGSALLQAAAATGQAPPLFEYCLTTPFARAEEFPLRVPVDARQEREKMAALARYVRLEGDIAATMAALGEAAALREGLRPAPFEPFPHDAAPYYEAYGQRMRDAGKYGRAIARGRHVEPLVRALFAEHAPCRAA